MDDKKGYVGPGSHDEELFDYRFELVGIRVWCVSGVACTRRMRWRNAAIGRKSGALRRRFSDVNWTNREKGLAFEEQVVTLMQTLNCHLIPTQQSRDGGIDHQGLWTFPDLQVDVVTQCKNESKPVGVQYVREFYGVLNFSLPTTVGLFASASGYSIYAQRFFSRMTRPAILCTVDQHTGRLSSFLLNDRAQTLLPKLTVGSLFVNQEHALILTYGDKILG